MKIIIEGAPKEIAALVLELQERQITKDLPLSAKSLMEEGEEQNGFYIG